MKVVTVTGCPAVIDVLLRTKSVVTLPWMTQMPPLEYPRAKDAVPDAEALAFHVPAIVVTPPEAVRAGLGRLIVHRRPDAGSAAAQFAGSVPAQNFRVPPDRSVAICEAQSFLVVVSNWKAILTIPKVECR